LISGCIGKDKQTLSDSAVKSSRVAIKGKIVLLIAVPRAGKPELNYEIYTISSDGKVTRHAVSTPTERLPLGSHMDDCKAKVPSPDNSFIVSCSTEPRFPSRPAQFTINGIDGKQIMVIPVMATTQVRGIAWAPDSKAIAALIGDEKYGKRPGDILSAFLGHPVPYANYSVRVYALDSTLVLSVPNIVNNLAYAWGSIQWTSE
jgi:hypothetical protein